MADIVVTAARVGLVDPLKSTVKSYIAGETILKGQAVFVETTGKVWLADEDAAGKRQFSGIALSGGGAGQAIDVCEDGELYGFTLAGLYDSIVYLSATTGALADSGDIMVGRVAPMANAAITKVLRIFVCRDKTWT